MKKQAILAINLGAMIIFSTMFAHAENKPAAEAKPDPCALFKPDDLTTLLGGKPVGTAKAGACNWTVEGSTKQFNAYKFPQTGMVAEMNFMTARKNATKGGKITVEKEIGDNAFSLLLPAGVVLLAIKQGQLLQLQYQSGVAGTEKDQEALRSLAKKAIETF